jgi:hypothetical protein
VLVCCRKGPLAPSSSASPPRGPRYPGSSRFSRPIAGPHPLEVTAYKPRLLTEDRPRLRVGGEGVLYETLDISWRSHPGQPRGRVGFSQFPQLKLLKWWRMRLRPGVYAAALAAFVVGAGVVYLELVPVHRVDGGRLAALAPATPPAGFAKKPVSAGSLAASSSPFAEVKTAAKQHADSTGSYSIDWSKSSSSSDSADLLVSVLPSAADAEKAEVQAKSGYLGSQSFKSSSYSYKEPIAVPSVPGASGALYQSSTSGAPPLVVIEFQTGRAQVTEFMAVSGSASSSESAALALARSEYDHLGATLPGLTLAETTWRPVVSLIYWAAIAAVVGAAMLVPVIRRRSRQRRQLAAERARLAHLSGRGAKILKRQAHPRR